MTNNIFRGLGIALVTPFKANGSIDEEALKRLISYQLEHGADFLCIFGTTAETPCLTHEEKKVIKDLVVRHVQGRVPIVMGCGGNNTAAVADELRSSDLSGIDGILSVCPYYNKPSQEGLYLHFKAVAEATSLPIILYNIESRTGVNLLPETVVRLAREQRNVVAVKEACGKLDQIGHLIDIKPDYFDVLSGDDSLTCQIIDKGGVGVISVVGNALTEPFSQMVHMALDGNGEVARQLNDRFSGLYKSLFKDGNPAGIKTLLHQMGFIENVLRLPLTPASDLTAREIADWGKSFGIF
ncbi:MAG: 4-hydroxy-tetrahydrodipicolinate synthase [Prevotella sp.]|nr:4-hydroxy-tetrahydrodipicolinate synthase [Prevotella sp.]